jgi:LacI family transcriptional regulator
MEVKKKILLKDIAKEVGVSTALVSYVLNNKNENRIGKEVATKIRTVAKALNYQPNQIAKSLKTQKTYTLGLIVADIANPFSSQLARIIEDEAKKQGYTVIFGSSDENLEKSNDLIKVLFNRQVDGFIIAAVENSEDLIQELDNTGVPFILVDRYFADKNFNYIVIDNYKATFEATQYLLAQNRKNIAFISYHTQLFHLEERKRGYEAALALAQKTSIVKCVNRENSQIAVKNAIDELLNSETPIDAIFFSNNLLAIHGLKYLKNTSVDIPLKMGIVAFDETDAFDLFHTPITYIRQPLEEIGQLATTHLLDFLKEGKKLIQIKLQAELKIGLT